MSTERDSTFLALDETDAGAHSDPNTLIFFVKIAAGVALVFAVINFLKGKTQSAPVIISEEERTERRKKALQRFAQTSNGDLQGHDEALNHDTEAGIKGALRRRAVAASGNYHVDSTLRGEQSSTSSGSSSKGVQTSLATLNDSLSFEVNIAAAASADSRVGAKAESNEINPDAAQIAEHESSDCNAKNTPKSMDYQRLAVDSTSVIGTGGKIDKRSKSEAEENESMKNNKSAEVPNSSKMKDESEESSVKRRGQRPKPPPAQILCEALSVVCGTQVTVVPGQGTWGGDGWVKKRRAAPNRLHSTSTLPAPKSPKIALPLSQQRQFQKDNTSLDSDSSQLKSTEEWSQLQSSFQLIVSSSSVATNPFRCILTLPYHKHCIATATSWYNRAVGRDLVGHILNVHESTQSSALASDREGLGGCLLIMAEYISGVMACWLDKDISGPNERKEDGESDDDDDEDLFTEDCKKVQTTADTVVANTAVQDILELCSKQNANLVVTKKLLGDVFSHSVDRSRLAKGILKLAFDRLRSADSSPAPSALFGSRGLTVHELRSFDPNLAPSSAPKASFESMTKNMAAVSHIIANSTDIAMSLIEHLNNEVESCQSGNAFERLAIFRPLVSLGGYTLPGVGFERDQTKNAIEMNHFYEALKSAKDFPLGYFDRAHGIDPSITSVVNEARTHMRQARSHASQIMRWTMRKGRDNVFSWLRLLIQMNEMQSKLIQEQLLNESDEVHGSLSSRPFLMGTALSILEMCGQDLVQNYERNSFDARYLGSTNGSLIFPSDERRLTDLSGNSERGMQHIPRSFSGATELFFLTSALLRISLFPFWRARDEFSHRYKGLFARLQRLAEDSSENHAHLPVPYTKCVAGLLGFDSCLDDPEVMANVIQFSLLQLRFLADLSKDGTFLVFIPESMVKLPSQYIAHIATHYQRYLSPPQAEAAVKYATMILGSGRNNLSIQVQTELMRISGAFVRASVQRALAKQRRRYRGGRQHGSSGSDDDLIDRRSLDIYTSLDRNDHGVVVFASPTASKHLGPTLLKTFIAMEAVEGLDVEKDHNFHKNMVQGEICELILRLWMHPCGEFKRSIASLDSDVLARFFRSVAASISIETDTVYQTILDIRDILEHHHSQGRITLPFGMKEKATLDSCYGRLPSFLGAMRRLLLVLCYLSQDERIAAILGDSVASPDIGVMIVSLVDKFTASNGGIHPLVDFRAALKSVANTASGRTPEHATGSVKELLFARAFAKAEFGFDVSLISNLLLSLATRWSLAAAKQSQMKDGRPALIDAIVSRGDFEISHFKCVFNRLIFAPQSTPDAGDKSFMVFESDGHVDFTRWIHYETPTGIGLEESRPQRKVASCQDQFSYSEIASIANLDQIKCFLDELGNNLPSASLNISKNGDEMLVLERQLLQGQSIDEEEYKCNLQDWVVSSDSFYGGMGAMDHFYNSNAKTRSNPSLGRILMKDARKCWKNLPSPHPNASIFVCYSEDRMDICRAIIIGASGTPYSAGVFQFDICYPQLYPSAPPMLHFMTTGGGQVRFSPNLYNDGKVCISLLGTTNAWDESQRWNPSKSSLAQVLLSIQSQILDVKEPYFAEGGGHGGVRGTRAGQKGSARYNNTLRLSTLRYAIIEQLKSPPKGFEDVTRRHFSMNRKRLMVQAKIWTLESMGTDLHGRFVKAYSELLVLLSSDKLACEDWELADAGGSIFGALPPLSDDLLALQRLDHSLHNDFISALRLGETM
eukprot:CAMPEP_0183709898 /NCGR_PEP_ID=MMETSP0737-20130205/5843_1 /TAXON_ID=385413 /ORGANISM="Thalassiosira miniscula, Strain CCMP1093" /LENGTH=1734 /DNA_ID=CAMNT_0025938115 /DNA_START=280 /DNA_END=5484 /DNA_ORIENTATION=-